MEIKKGDLVQFTENHKWFLSVGIVEEVKRTIGDIKYLIGVPIPEKGIAYIFSMKSDNDFEKVGESLFVQQESSDYE